MYTLDMQPITELVQEEPALEISIPEVFIQPELKSVQRGKLKDVESLINRIYSAYSQNKGNGGLGMDYQTLVNEFQPLFCWATACWDYLLSTEGCRFILRHGDEKMLCRGDYRAITDKEYSRMVHKIFRDCFLEFAQSRAQQHFSNFLRSAFWDRILNEYRSLENPPDPRQRKLTAYSYLRCIPYKFLNPYHHELVNRTIKQLSYNQRNVIDKYFLHFYTLDTTSSELAIGQEETQNLINNSLLKLLIDNRLVYCLLRQIERY